jgi:hypothetical protein
MSIDSMYDYRSMCKQEPASYATPYLLNYSQPSGLHAVSQHQGSSLPFQAGAPSQVYLCRHIYIFAHIYTYFDKHVCI